MTSISAAASSTYLTPLQKLQQELQTEVASGKVSSGDQNALASALTDIDAALQGGQTSGTTGAKPSPDGMQSKIDDLISGEVSSGKLTDGQAGELKDLFKAAFAGGPGGAGGSPSGAASATGSTDGTDSTSDASDMLQKFLASLQQTLAAASPNSSYSASGSTASASSTTSFSALLVDYQT
jgi:hypothetical protein